jgi:hypothetical protein
MEKGLTSPTGLAQTSTTGKSKVESTMLSQFDNSLLVEDEFCSMCEQIKNNYRLYGNTYACYVAETGKDGPQFASASNVSRVTMNAIHPTSAFN